MQGSKVYLLPDRYSAKSGRCVSVGSRSMSSNAGILTPTVKGFCTGAGITLEKQALGTYA
jgi:hypothetical protein